MVIYKPRSKIAIASSFEGIFNDGATECGFVSYNALTEMPGYTSPFGRKIEAAEFDSIKDSGYMRAFLLLRPIVEVAEDYLTVIQVLQANPNEMDFLLKHPNNPEAYKPLIKKIWELKSNPERKKFKEEFYKERERAKKLDYKAWLNTQEPLADTLQQFRNLAATMEVDEQSGEIKSGFVPWLATSKDEASSHELCVVYSSTGKLKPDDIGANKCIVVRSRIIGKERTTDKVKQLELIAKSEDLDQEFVWRLNDRYDPEQQEQLAKAGFHNQFLVPSYMFLHDIETARKDPKVVLLERKIFADQLGELAKSKGL